jgi:hypothetical protein
MAWAQERRRAPLQALRRQIRRAVERLAQQRQRLAAALRQRGLPRGEARVRVGDRARLLRAQAQRALRTNQNSSLSARCAQLKPMSPSPP